MLLFSLLFIVCLAIGLPVFVCLGVPPLLELFLADEPLVGFAQTLYSGVNQFTLLAIPCFVLAGSIMGRSGITEDLVEIMKAAVGRLPGGLAMVTVMVCTFFAAISGSGPGTVAAVGSLLIPAMVREGYSKDFAAAVSSSGGVLGVLIPPSNPMIIYGVIASVSIGDMFIAGIVPGLFMALLLMGMAFFISLRRGYGSSESGSASRLLSAMWKGKYSLMMPFIVLGGIYAGIVTPVEAAVMAVVYALLVALFIKRSITLGGLWDCLSESSGICGGLVVIMGTAVFFGEFLTLQLIPQAIAAAILSVVTNKYVLLLLIVLLLLLLGTFMETLSTIMILAPILLPIVKTFGISPIQFGVILAMTSAIGMMTPPLGVNLFVACNITGLRLEDVARRVTPFIAAMLVGLAVVVLFPWMSLVLLGN